MRGFITILFIFFCLFLIIFWFAFDPLLLFLVIFLAFFICFFCSGYYLGAFRGIVTALIYCLAPFVIEYFLYHYNFPFVHSALINYLTFEELDLPITLNNLFTVFSTPLLFISSLF